MLLTPQPTVKLDHINGWIFDLDNTIYPAESGLFPQVSERMTSYLQSSFNISRDAAFAMRKDLFERFGTTGRGLMEDHDMDPHDFLSYVHDIDLSEVKYDADLDRTLGELPGRKVIFTNGTTDHAARILDAYRIHHHFDYCYDIFKAEHRPKPDPVIYDHMLAETGLDPKSAVMIEDMAVNLGPAHDRGITTIWLDHDLDWTKSGMTATHIDYIARDLKTFFSALA